MALVKPFTCVLLHYFEKSQNRRYVSRSILLPDRWRREETLPQESYLDARELERGEDEGVIVGRWPQICALEGFCKSAWITLTHL